jgi:hypothetical protein
MNFDQLITNLRELDRSLKERAIRVVNVGLSARSWLVGVYLVEFEQNGEDRAAAEVTPSTGSMLFCEYRVVKTR